MSDTTDTPTVEDAEEIIETFPASYYRTLAALDGLKGKAKTAYVNQAMAKQATHVSACQRNQLVGAMSKVILHGSYVPHIELTQRGDVRCKCDVTHPWNRRKRTQAEILEALAIALDD